MINTLLYPRRLATTLSLLCMFLGFSVNLSGQVEASQVNLDRSLASLQVANLVGFGLKAGIGLGWPGELQLLEQTTSDLPYIGLVGLQYRGEITHRWSYGMTVEGMLTYRSGKLAGRAYEMRNLSLGFESLLAYQFPNPKWHLHAGMQLRTHRPFSSMDIKRRDNLRFEPRIMGSYQVARQLHLTSTFGRRLRARDDAAYFSDPPLQLLIGMLWMFQVR